MSLDWTTLTDGELAALGVAGRQAAFAEIVRRHRQPVFRLARAWAGDPDEALDLTQETFVAAYRALARYDGERSMRAWLSTIALNKCRDWSRKRAVRRFLSFAVPIGGEAEAIADDQVALDDAAADRQELDAALAYIPRLSMRTVAIPFAAKPSASSLSDAALSPCGPLPSRSTAPEPGIISTTGTPDSSGESIVPLSGPEGPAAST